jgi:hypothetical protein
MKILLAMSGTCDEIGHLLPLQDATHPFGSPVVTVAG